MGNGNPQFEFKVTVEVREGKLQDDLHAVLSAVADVVREKCAHLEPKVTVTELGVTDR